MFILRNTKTGRYVAPPGSVHSYTSYLENARVFRTPEDAEKERCVENEELVDVMKLFESRVVDAV